MIQQLGSSGIVANYNHQCSNYQHNFLVQLVELRQSSSFAIGPLRSRGETLSELQRSVSSQVWRFHVVEEAYPREKILHAILQRIMLNLARFMHDFRTIMHDHATSCIAHESLRVEYGLVRKSCMNHAKTCKIFFLGYTLNVARIPNMRLRMVVQSIGYPQRYRNLHFAITSPNNKEKRALNKK